MAQSSPQTFSSQSNNSPSSSYVMAWIVTAIFFVIGFYHTGVGLSEAKFLGGAYGSFLLALGLLIFMSLAYRTAVQTGSRVAFALYLLCAFVSYVCNFNSLYPNYMGYALIEKELKEKLKTYQQFAEIPKHVMAQRANNLPENYQRERATLDAELRTGDGARAGAAVTRIEKLLAEKGNPVVINRLTLFEPRDQWRTTYLENADKAFEAKMNELIPCYDVLKERDSKIIVPLKYISKTEPGFQREVDDELRKPQNDVKIKERLELIEKMVQTYKEHCTAINNSNCRDNTEYQKAKCDENIRVKNKDLGRFDHTFPSAYENIGEAGTLAILFICFMLDFLVPIGLFFLLRGYEKEAEAQRQADIQKTKGIGRFGN